MTSHGAFLPLRGCRHMIFSQKFRLFMCTKKKQEQSSEKQHFWGWGEWGWGFSLVFGSRLVSEESCTKSTKMIGSERVKPAFVATSLRSPVGHRMRSLCTRNVRGVTNCSRSNNPPESHHSNLSLLSYLSMPKAD